MRDQVAASADQGRKLTPEERSRLVNLLLESQHEAPVAEVEAGRDAVVEDRLAAYDRGEIQSVDGEEVLAKALRLAER